MINGVEILATQEVVSVSMFNWSAYWICAGLVFAIFLIAGIATCACYSDFESLVIYVIVGIVCAAILGLIPGFAFKVPTEYETQYKVTISDEVQMNDFLERYEIVSQEGKIYTVRERKDGK